MARYTKQHRQLPANDQPSSGCIAKLLMTNILLLLIILLIYLITTFKSNDDDDVLNQNYNWITKSSNFFTANNISLKESLEFCLPGNNNRIKHEEEEELLNEFRQNNVCKEIDWQKYSDKLQHENSQLEIQIHRYNEMMDENDDEYNHNRINLIVLIKFILDHHNNHHVRNSIRIIDMEQTTMNRFRYIVQIENNFPGDDDHDEQQQQQQQMDYHYSYDENIIMSTRLEYWANRIWLLNLTTMALFRFDDDEKIDHICLINYYGNHTNRWECL
ncbi:hypothetical protein DERF_003800 [Dermatophagoides farinae]|uniref:Uncharacterized protein n=1 Tax=Dermatophagoides farinae TaxID=6954 RepID=A0A922IH02_DERFA|nr:hypothetical protein HUG17_5669 [Dermatophagoides farinae]KAH9529949.1 hypothetical protein DERF_003800 [Dermatophagoides farinae]